MSVRILFSLAFLIAAMVTIVALARANKAQPFGKVETVLSTGFAYDGDTLAGGRFFCLRRAVDSKTPGVAHRWRKCGSRVKITNRRTGRSVWARVIDRGPYWLVPTSCARGRSDRGGFAYVTHKCWARGRIATKKERIDALKRKPPRDGWEYANGLDMTPPTYKAIRFNGREPVDLRWRK